MALSVVWILLLPFTACVVSGQSPAFDMELEPKNAIWRIGGNEVMRCSVKNCATRVVFTWTTLEDRPLFATIQSNDTESLLTYTKISKQHENKVVCIARCGTATKRKNARVNIYVFPSDPVITGHDRLALDGENTLTCQVFDVYPSEYIEIEWVRGERVVENHDVDFVGNTVVSNYTLTPTSQNDGESITCRAHLQINGLPTDQRIRETTVVMTVLSTPRNIRVSEHATVKQGDSLTLTCEVEGNPEPRIAWTVLRERKTVVVGEGHKLTLQNVTHSDAGDYECIATNSQGTQTAKLTVNVQGSSINTSITVSPSDEVKEGESVTVSCQTDSSPAGRVVLRREEGGQETELQSSDGTHTSVTIPSARLSDSGLYVCEASNVYGSHRNSVQLTVRAHPMTLELSPGDGAVTAERGSVLVLSCLASGCPQPLFSWRSLLGSPLQRPSHTKGSLSQLRLSPLELEDEGTYACEVTCGSVVESKRVEVKVFSLPSSPVIERSGPFLEGVVATLRCSVLGVFPSSLFRILWLLGGKELLSETGSYSSQLQNLTSTLSYLPGAADQGQNITCRVTLMMDNVPPLDAEKSDWTEVIVHYSPRNTSITARLREEPKEGESVTVSCQTDSSPAGRVVLRREEGGQETELQSSDGTHTSVTIPSARLSDSGLYVCEASNVYGRQRDSVQLTVRAPPRNTTVELFPSERVKEGQNVTVYCHSTCFPPPAILLRNLGRDTELSSSDGTFQLINLTTNDTGLYVITVINDLGSETVNFTINVTERSFSALPFHWSDVAFPALGLGIATVTIAGMLEHLRRARRKGLYEVASGNPNIA